MLCFKEIYLILFIMLTVLRKTECRRTKKSKFIHQPPPLTDYPSTKYLPSDSQITVFLQHNENRTFHFFSSMNNTPLSVTIISCNSPVYWSLKSNSSGINNKSIDTETYSFRSVVGPYLLGLYSETNSYVHIYITRTVEFPLEILNESKERRLKLLKRRRRRKLTAQWDQSLVDPYATTYCLVINSRRSYNTLCSAQLDTNAVILQDNAILKTPHVHRITQQLAPKIICTGNKTHYTLSNLLQDAKYYFNVFATNGNTNLTYLHGSAVINFNNHIKPIFLKDGKLTAANLKKLDGKAVFTFKLGKKVNETLGFYVIPCGGAVDIMLKYNTHRTKKRIKGFGKIEVKSPSLNTKYHLKVMSLNRYEFGKTSGVKILATTKMYKTPFPALPTQTIVHEYISLRRCDSVTIGWYAAQTEPDVKYCIAAKKGKLPEVGGHRIPDNCRIDYQMKSMANISYCKVFKERTGEIIVERIGNLDPDQSYIIYVTIKKKQGKSLSYDLLQIRTKPKCD